MVRTLTSLVEALDSIAPPPLAAEWDRTGLLIEPGSTSSIDKVLCAIDLTEAVLAEARELGAGLIVAYHPLIFRGLTGLRTSRPDERVAVGCVRHGIAVYSPHTAWDAVEGGATDWLCDGLELECSRRPIEPQSADPTAHEVSKGPSGLCASGHGRVLRLHSPISLDELLPRIKNHLEVDRLRVASGSNPGEIRTVAVCPGAGGSILEQVSDADLYWTGEMRHHDVLAARARGTSVVLSEHSLTERGSLVRLAELLRTACPGLEVFRSRTDRDPLEWR